MSDRSVTDNAVAQESQLRRAFTDLAGHTTVAMLAYTTLHVAAVEADELRLPASRFVIQQVQQR